MMELSAIALLKLNNAAEITMVLSSFKMGFYCGISHFVR